MKSIVQLADEAQAKFETHKKVVTNSMVHCNTTMDCKSRIYLLEQLTVLIRIYDILSDGRDYYNLAIARTINRTIESDKEADQKAKYHVLRTAENLVRQEDGKNTIEAAVTVKTLVNEYLADN